MRETYLDMPGASTVWQTARGVAVGLSESCRWKSGGLSGFVGISMEDTRIVEARGETGHGRLMAAYLVRPS